MIMVQKTKEFVQTLSTIFAFLACIVFHMPVQAQVSTGTYRGTMKVYLDKTLSTTENNQYLRVEELRPGIQYAIYLDEFTVSSFDIPSLKCKATAKRSAKGIIVHGKISNKTGPFPVIGSIEGVIDTSGIAKMTYTLHFGKMPMVIYAHYDGKK